MTLRAKLRGRVHLLSDKGRWTKCGRSLGHVVDEGGIGDPLIFEADGSRILVKIDAGMEGVTCHHCRWGRSNKSIKDRGL